MLPIVLSHDRFSTSHAARCVACHGVRSHAVPENATLLLRSASSANSGLDLAPSGKVYPTVMPRDGLLIGEVAQRTGLSRKALRLYEARGILPPARRTSSGYRTYAPDVLGLLHFVTQARRLGLTLAEIESIVALRCARPGPCAHVRALLERKVTELDDLGRELRRILNTWDASSQRQGVVCQHIEGGRR
jgi:MerR family copper efflux transcriptional regulator